MLACKGALLAFNFAMTLNRTTELLACELPASLLPREEGTLPDLNGALDALFSPRSKR
jgi:hypothetical protein